MPPDLSPRSAFGGLGSCYSHKAGGHLGGASKCPPPGRRLWREQVHFGSAGHGWPGSPASAPPPASPASAKQSSGHCCLCGSSGHVRTELLPRLQPEPPAGSANGPPLGHIYSQMTSAEPAARHISAQIRPGQSFSIRLEMGLLCAICHIMVIHECSGGGWQASLLNVAQENVCGGLQGRLASPPSLPPSKPSTAAGSAGCRGRSVSHSYKRERPPRLLPRPPALQRTVLN